jgi:small subunit ribosomal protein S20
MANHKSAKKRHLQSEKRRINNRGARSTLRTQVKKARAEIAAGNASGTAGEVKSAVEALAKAGGGLMHKRAASRRISRLMKAANRSQAAKA